MRMNRFFSGLVGMLALAPGAGLALEPDVLFERASQSIIVIHGFDTRVQPMSYGSGVVIAPETVITNCHVLAKTRTILVKRRNATYKATLQFADVERDLCQLNVPDLAAPAVTLGTTTSGVRVGQRAYAIGNPIGLELTLSDGLISGFRNVEGSDVPRIQTSAPASPGSSGGGLFDSDGKLIGITTATGRGAQNITIAHPVEWIRELPERRKAALARQQTDAAAAASAAGLAAASGSLYPRVLTGDELAKHFDGLQKVEVISPRDLLSLTFRPGNRFDFVYWSRGDPSGISLRGTYQPRSGDQVCLTVPVVGALGGAATAGWAWMRDCF